MTKTDLIKNFEKIRDLPYSLQLQFSKPNFCCSGKSVMLKRFFESNGIPARYRVVDFKWSKLGIPQEILSISHAEDTTTHVFIEVFLNNKWIKIDPTWDKGLSRILPVASWDGENDTAIAVPVEKYYGDEESEKMMIPEDEEEFKKERAENLKFYQAINEWLQKMRLP